MLGFGIGNLIGGAVGTVGSALARRLYRHAMYFITSDLSKNQNWPKIKSNKKSGIFGPRANVGL